MLKYIGRRLVYMVFVLFIISLIMFALYKAMPGDPVAMMLEDKSSMKPERYQAVYEQTRIRMGLDKSIPVQYVRWLTNTLSGDFGYSFVYKMPVVRMIAAPMQNTIKLNIGGMIFVFLITIPLGIRQAVKRGSTFDNSAQVITIIGYSLPVFIFGILFIFLFSVTLKIFPISGSNTPGFRGTGIAKTIDSLKYMALPMITYVFSSLGSLTRYVRAAMLDALSQDYIRTARAKGLMEKSVIYSHAFRNSLLPFVTIMMGWFIGIFSGSLLIERMFLWNGMGGLMISSLMQQDFAVVLAVNMFYAVLALGGNLLVDIMYGLVDPRVKLT